MAPVGNRNSTDDSSVLDEESRQKLINHVGILSRNVYASDTLLENLLDRRILTKAEHVDIKRLRSSEARITKVVHSLLTKCYASFKEFCEVLRTNGHSFFASSLQESDLLHLDCGCSIQRWRVFVVLAARLKEKNKLVCPRHRVLVPVDNSFRKEAKDFQDFLLTPLDFPTDSFFNPMVWKELPEIEKKLQKKERESLEEKFNTKMMEMLMLRSACEHKPVERRVSESRLKQLQMEHKLKCQTTSEKQQKAIDALTDQLDFLKRKAQEQEDTEELKRQRMETTIKKLTSNLQVANRFNIANDNTIRRTQECLELYEDLVNFMHAQLPQVASKSPLFQDELDFEDVKVASTLKLRVSDMKERLCRQQIRLQLFENRSEEYDDLKRFLKANFGQNLAVYDGNDNIALIKQEIEEVLTSLHERIDKLENEKESLMISVQKEQEHVKRLQTQVPCQHFLSTVSVGVNNVPLMENKSINTNTSRSSRIKSKIFTQNQFCQTDQEPVIEVKPKSRSDNYDEIDSEFQLVPFVKSLSKPRTLTKRTSLIITDEKMKLPPLSPDLTMQTKGYLPFSFQIERKSKHDYLDNKRRDSRKKITSNSYQFL